eukprot:364499-Chlamydomonas_euryale.AAC.2
MDDATFLAVKDRLEELGAVDHTGLNTHRLTSMRVPWWRCRGREGRRRHESEALALDMGQYMQV